MGAPAETDERENGTGDAAESPLVAVLPHGRLRPGTAASTGGDMPLLLELAAQTPGSASGWAAVGLPQLGTLAAESAGLDLTRGMRIDYPGDRWGQVLAIVLEAVPVVLLGALGPVTTQTARRLGAVLRRSGSILLAADQWEGAEVRLRVVTATWDGVGQGHGLLNRRRVTVAATGRGAAAAPTYTDMWLPGPTGRAAPARELQETTTPAAPVDTFLQRRRAALHVAG